MSDHEVTQAEYETVMGVNPSYFQGDPNRPVDQVDWNNAVLYCQRLTEQKRMAGHITAQQAYRLPTEAEWEYAARAGTAESLDPILGDILNDIAWWSFWIFPGNAGGSSHPVQQKVPNAWGLYDMIGNVAEWCLDWHGSYPTGSVTDPTGPETGYYRVVRGGSWDIWGRTTFIDRGVSNPFFRASTQGFRPVLGPIP
jgi:formylglycine-generating enzyme required for sulfatase activity